MAKNCFYRKINTSFWQDSKISEQMNINERYVFLYLLTNPHTNLSGIYEITRKQICDETGFSKEELNKLMKRLISLKLIHYDEETSEVLITNWSRYNWTSSAQLLKGVENELIYVKSLKLYNILKEYLINTDYVIEENGIDSISISYKYDIARNKKTVAEAEEELESRSKKVGVIGFSLSTSEMNKLSSRTGVDINQIVKTYDSLRLSNFISDNGEVINNKTSFANYINTKFDTGKTYDEDDVIY